MRPNQGMQIHHLNACAPPSSSSSPLGGVGDVLVGEGSHDCNANQLEQVADEGQPVNGVHGRTNGDLGHNGGQDDRNGSGLLGIGGLLPDVLRCSKHKGRGRHLARSTARMGPQLPRQRPQPRSCSCSQ